MKNFVLPIFILLIQTIWAQIPSYVPVYGLLSYYPFNGNSNDLSPFNNHLTNNGAALTSDRFGNSNAAYDFDGLSSYLTRANPSYTFNANSTFSVSFWYKRMNTANLGIPIMHATTASGNFVWIFQLASVNMQYGTNKQGSAWIWAPSTTTTDIWTHIVMIYDAGQMKLFKDNVLVATSTFTHTGVSSTTLPLLVGKGVGGSHFYGQIDDIGIWNRTLSTCEINDLFNGSNSLSTLNAGPDQYACNGSQVTLNAIGANSYNWSPNIVNGSSFSPTISQNYTVTGFDANGCSAWDQVAVIAQNVNINAGQDLHLCPGDSAILNATGYPGIQWSGGISNNTPFLPIQTQYFIASASNSNGCSDADTVTVFVNSLPQLNAGPDQQICFGDEAILHGTGGIFMYWNNGVADSIPFIPFTTTSYILTGASPEGCLSTDTVTIFVTESTSSTLNISAIDSYSLNGQTYTASGTYTQLITNTAGCDSLITLNLTLDFTAAQNLTGSFWKLYPNPASNYTTLAIEEAVMGSAIILCDAFGREMLRSVVQAQETIIDLHHIPTGLYFVQVGSETRRLEVVR